jgi:hypothetical protein
MASRDRKAVDFLQLLAAAERMAEHGIQVSELRASLKAALGYAKGAAARRELRRILSAIS